MSRPPPQLSRRASAAALALALGGCAAPGPVFPPVEPPIVWPAAPDPPRFAWVGELRGEADLKAPRSFWTKVTEIVVGAAAPAVFRSVHGVAVTPSDVVWVADPEAGVVHRLDLERREYLAIAQAGDGRPAGRPIGVALAGDEVLVADRAARIVSVYAADGTPRRVIGEGELSGPVGVAVGALGRVFVVDTPAHVVKVFAPDGALVARIGERGEAPGQFNFPTYVACDRHDNVYVSDSLNSRVQVFDPTGRFLRALGVRGDTPGNFSQPKGLACDGAGRLYVVDSHFENVQVFDADGTLLMALGGEGRGPGELWLPVGVFAGADGRLWVADSFNRRVQVVRYIGDVSTEVSSEGGAIDGGAVDGGSARDNAIATRP